MKQLSFVVWLLCLLLGTACSSDDKRPADLPQINLEKMHYALAKGSTEVKLVAEEPTATEVVIPFTLYGKAVEGTDYTLSAHAFTFKPGEQEATVTFTRIEESIGDEGSELTLNLDRHAAPQGFVLGLLNYTVVELMGKNTVIASFKKNADLLTLSGNFNIQLEKMSGGVYKTPAALTYPIEVDPSSTAVEGVHFEFVNGPFAKIAKGRYEGSVALRFLKHEPGKDRLVLRLGEMPGYGNGGNPTIQINVQGAYNISGTWAFRSITNKEWWENMWYEDTSNFPTGTEEDQLVFEGTDYRAYTFTPKLSGGLKNYFTAACPVTFLNEREEQFQEIGMGRELANIAVLEFDHINVNFSATQSRIRKAVVGFRILRETGSPDVLECTIYDYEPTDFLNGVYEMYKDYGSDPIMLEAPLRLQFVRVK